MIISRLNGGLGNQMFQYAAGRCLAVARNTELKLDISQFSDDPLRDYDLSAFRIHEDLATDEDMIRVKRPLSWRVRHPVKAFQAGLYRDSVIRYIKERHFQFDPDFFSLPDNVCLEGYWQSEKYFKPIEPLIRAEFHLRDNPRKPVQELAELMAEGDAISIHIRRGDFVNNPATSATHGTCPAGYYQQAAREISRHIDDPRFWIFSDDPAWAKENLALDYPASCVSDHHLKDYEDLFLMSRCRHHIIANSSFSWWGAYLGTFPEKIVIAPKRWFATTAIVTTDLLPESWIQR